MTARRPIKNIVKTIVFIKYYFALANFENTQLVSLNNSKKFCLIY